MDRQIVVVAHNIRSAHNVGSLFRTCEGLGVQKLYLTGYTPYPAMKNDPRIPHLAQKIDKQIDKTALDAQKTLLWENLVEIDDLISKLKTGGFSVVALEQSPGSISLQDFKPPQKIALIVGNEVVGLDKDQLALSDNIVEIPMLGNKESFNVVQASAMALYALTFYN